MLSITQWAGSVGRRFLGTGAGADDGTDPAATDEPQSSLFHCPDCTAVYIATDKRTCSTCDTTVDRIPSTLTETA